MESHGCTDCCGFTIRLGSAASAAEKPTLTIDQHKSQYLLDDVVNEVHDAWVCCTVG